MATLIGSGERETHCDSVILGISMQRHLRGPVALVSWAILALGFALNIRKDLSKSCTSLKMSLLSRSFSPFPNPAHLSLDGH